MLVIVLFYVFLGLLLVGLSIPLMVAKVPPNRWYGFRIPLTLQDPDIWYAVNAWAGRKLLLVGLATLIAALLGLVLPGAWLPVHLLLTSVFLVAGVLLILVFGIRYARSF